MSGEALDVPGAVMRSTRWVIIGAVLGKVIHVTGHAVVVRKVTPDAFGLFTLGVLTVSIVQIVCEFGIGNALLQQPDESAQRSGFSLLLGAASLFFLAGIGFSGPIAAAIGDPRLAALFKVMSARFLLVPFLTVANVRLTRRLRYGELTAAGLSSNAVGAVGAIALVYSGLGVWALVAGDLLTLAVQCAIVLRFASGPPSPAFERAHVLKLGAFGALVLAESLLGILIVSVDGFLLGKIGGAERLGFYRLGSSIGLAAVLTITGPLMGVTFAALSRLSLARTQFEATALDALCLISHLNCAWAAFVVPCASLVVAAVFGPAWSAAAPMTAILAGFAAVAAPGMVPPQAYRALGRPRINVLFLSAQLAVVLPVFFFAARRGERVLAWSQLAQVAVFTTVSLSIFCRVVGVSPRSVLEALRAPYLVGVLVASWNVLLGPALGGVGVLPRLLVHAATSACLWLALVWGLDRKTWRTLSRLALGGTT